MAIKLWGIPNCDTVKRARSELASAGREVVFADFKKTGVPEDRLPIWAAAVGWERLLNRKGTTWRQLAPEARAAVGDAASAMALMATQASVIKRPVIEWEDGRVTVGWPQALEP